MVSVTAVLLLSALSFGASQGLTDPAYRVEFNGLTHRELARLIFAGERKMLNQLRAQPLIMETYLQSLSSGGQDALPVGDAYFLGEVDLRHNFRDDITVRPGALSLWFGRAKTDQFVAVPGHRRLKLNPDGDLDMLFVDISNFDSDTYELTYESTDTVGNTPCLLFSVTPLDPDASALFTGQIWVETSAFKIIRIEGTFTPLPVSVRGHWYFHFDAYRQMVSPGAWVPATSYFEATGQEKNGLPGVHIRGRTFIWGYANAAGGKEPSLSTLSDNRLWSAPGPVEDRLETMIKEIEERNHLREPEVHCRVLLTTPLELFNVGNTVILSRGLLDMIPDDSVLTVLLAHEIAHILSVQPRVSLGSAWYQALLDSPVGARVDFPNTWDDSTRETAAQYLTLKLLDPLQASAQIESASSFLATLRSQTSTLPNLLRTRFGTALVNHDPMVPVGDNFPAQESHQLTPEPLPLRDRYGVEVQSGRILDISRATVNLPRGGPSDKAYWGANSSRP